MSDKTYQGVVTGGFRIEEDGTMTAFLEVCGIKTMSQASEVVAWLRDISMENLPHRRDQGGGA